MATYVEVPREAVFSAMEKAGFTAAVQGSEVVFVRAHHRCHHLLVKVYTSLSADAATARGCGDDAIRVVAAYEKKEGPKPVSFAIHKGKRVYRAGTVDAVLARMLERAREAYAACNERCKGDKRCWDCCGRPA